MSQSTNERIAFAEFLDRLAAGKASIADWNQFVLRKYKDSEVEACRQRLADLGLSIGQCSAIPFPPALQQVAAELRDDLLTDL